MDTGDSVAATQDVRSEYWILDRDDAMLEPDARTENVRVLKLSYSLHQMTQSRSRSDGNRPFFRKGLSVTSQFDMSFFFSRWMSWARKSTGFRAARSNPPISGQERQKCGDRLYRDYTTPITTTVHDKYTWNWQWRGPLSAPR